MPSPCRAAGCIIPPLPEKNVVEKYRLTDDFIEQRRAALAVFLNRIVRGLLNEKRGGACVYGG